MSETLQKLLSALGKFFLGIFTKSDIPVQSQPINPPTPVPTVNPPTPQAPIPQPALQHVNPYTGHVIIPSGKGPQSSWWDGTFRITQPYGCTDFSTEGHNPYHPECAYFHEGIDFALPCGTPIYAGSFVSVMAIDPPGYGPLGDSAAIQLRLSTFDVWIYHMHDYAVRVGQHLAPGTLIGHSGTRGYSTGCHAHFEVRHQNLPYRQSLDPEPLLFFPS